MKPKDKIKVDELLNSLNTGKIRELMSPTKPLKRQMHIEILNWKDDKIKEKLAIKPKDSISKMIVEFNVANREILKIRKVKGELKQLYELLRIKEHCNKYKISEGTINAWLNETVFPQLKTTNDIGRPIDVDYGKIHERIFLCNSGTNAIPMVLGVHYKDEVDREGKLVNHAGDITKLGLAKTVDWKDITELLKIGTRMFWKNVGRLRLVECNGTNDNINRMGSGFLRDCGWYRISNRNRPITGYFPYKTMLKHGVNVDLRVDRVRLGEELLQYYSRIDGVRPRTRSRSSGNNGLLQLPLETRVVIARGNARSRDGLNNGRQECRIIAYNDDGGDFSYRAEFPNGARWYITTEEIVEVLGRERRMNDVLTEAEREELERRVRELRE